MLAAWDPFPPCFRALVVNNIGAGRSVCIKMPGMPWGPKWKQSFHEDSIYATFPLPADSSLEA